jgi:hypothetical protein
MVVQDCDGKKTDSYLRRDYPAAKLTPSSSKSITPTMAATTKWISGFKAENYTG